MTASERPSLAPLVLLSVLSLAGLWCLSQPIATNDLHIFLASGRWMAEHGALLRQEVFTWTAAGEPFANPTWGFSWAAWTLHQAAGLQGLRLANALAVVLCLAGLSAAIRAEGGSPLASAVGALWAFFLLFGNIAVRGQTWVFPIFSGAILLAALPWRPGLKLLAAVALGGLWSNLHGSVAVGIAWMGISGLASALTRRELRAGWPTWSVALGLACGSLLNPEGLGAWGFVLDNSAAPLERGFIEWYRPTLLDFQGQRFYGSLVLWAGLVLWRRADLRGWGILLAFTLLACTGTRFVAWYGLALAPVLGAHVDRGDRRSSPLLTAKKTRLLGALLAALYLALGIKTLLTPPRLHPDTPVALVDALQAHCGDCAGRRILNPPEFGGYLNFRIPQLQTSGDIRAWVFPDRAWAIYPELSAAPEGWEERLEAHQVDLLLLSRAFHEDSLIPAVRTSEEWLVLCEDEIGMLATRSPGE